jgi:pyruvate/2-oxoglutarate dehydrogenase complex dihydrolipoamide acyltransferase (E2) component
LAESIQRSLVDVVALTGLRRVIADRMMESLATSPQLSFHRDVDITELLERRRAWKAQGQNLSLEDCAIWSLANTLAKFPELNGLVDPRCRPEIR